MRAATLITQSVSIVAVFMRTSIQRKYATKELLRNNFLIVRRIFLRECRSKIRRIAGYVTDF